MHVCIRIICLSASVPVHTHHTQAGIRRWTHIGCLTTSAIRLPSTLVPVLHTLNARVLSLTIVTEVQVIAAPATTDIPIERCVRLRILRCCWAVEVALGHAQKRPVVLFIVCC